MWFSLLLEFFSGIVNFWNCILMQIPRYRMFHSISPVFFPYWGKINFLIQKATQIGQQWLGNFVMEQRWNYKKFFLWKNLLKLISFNLFLQQSQLRCLGIKKWDKFREVGKKQDNHHAHLSVKFPTSFLKFCSEICILLIDFSASHCQTI